MTSLWRFNRVPNFRCLPTMANILASQPSVTKILYESMLETYTSKVPVAGWCQKDHFHAQKPSLLNFSQMRNFVCDRQWSKSRSEYGLYHSNLHHKILDSLKVKPYMDHCGRKRFCGELGKDREPLSTSGAGRMCRKSLNNSTRTYPDSFVLHGRVKR